MAADKEDKGSAAKAKASEKATPKGKGKGKEERRPAEERERDADSRRREFDAANTPYMSVGARGWDTPPSEGYEDDDWAARGPSKRRRTSPGPADSPPRIRDDLTLDAFQRNYTSEDNASFAKIVDVENARRREEKSWAWAAEQVAADKRIEGEERRKLILDAATNGEWRVDAHGRRLIGGLAQGASADAEGEAWRERKMITAGDGSSESSGALVKSSGSSAGAGALIKSTSASSASALPPPAVEERPLPPDHPLARALTTAGLPPTALVSTADGAVVPQREAVGGHGDGRGRGSGERAVRATAERGALADEEALPNDIQQWEYKAMNNLMFLPNANEAPYPKPKAASASSSSAKPLANKPTIAYRNTRLADDEEEGYAASTVTSSPARSMIDAAVRGQECKSDPYVHTPNTY